MRRRPALVAAAAAALLLVPATPAVAAPATISGAVTLGGAAHDDVLVTWFDPEHRLQGVTQTDAAGRFSLQAPPAGTRYLLAVNVADVLTRPQAGDSRYLPAYVGTAPDDVAAAPLAEPVLADGSDRSVSVDVARAARVSGRNPAFARTAVRLVTEHGRRTGQMVASRTGSWSFQVAPGAYRIEVDAHDGWLGHRSRVFRVGTADRTVTSAPARTGALHGTVTSQGRPVRGVAVRFDGPDTSTVAVGTPTRTDRHGRWTRKDLAPGRITVTVGGDFRSGAGWVATRRAVVLRSGGSVRVDASVRRGATLTASVRPGTGATRWTALLQDRRGRPVREAQSPFRATTAASPLRFDALAPGAYRLLIGDRHHLLDRAVRITGSRTVRLGALRPAGAAASLEGTAPAGAQIQLTQGPATATVTAGADGRFRADGLIPGAYTAVVVATGFRGSTTTVRVPAAGPVALDAGAAVDQDFQRVSGRILAGAVPVPSASIVLADGYPITVSDGRVVSGILQPGPHPVRAVDASDGLFPRNTPYELAWPTGPITVQRGVDVDLGTVALTVRGGA